LSERKPGLAELRIREKELQREGLYTGTPNNVEEVRE